MAEVEFNKLGRYSEHHMIACYHGSLSICQAATSAVMPFPTTVSLPDFIRNSTYQPTSCHLRCFTAHHHSCLFASAHARACAFSPLVKRAGRRGQDRWAGVTQPLGKLGGAPNSHPVPLHHMDKSGGGSGNGWEWGTNGNISLGHQLLAASLQPPLQVGSQGGKRQTEELGW